MMSALLFPGTSHGLLITLSGFLLGLLACALLAAIEYGAWALVLPPRLRTGRERRGWTSGGM